jgi:hypothetical protein
VAPPAGNTLAARARPHPAALVLRLVGPPLTAFLLACLALYAVTKADGLRYFDAFTWSRSDSGFYVDIAQAGFSLGRCPQDPSQWCGSAGWFPGFPLLFAPLVHLGLEPYAAALATSLVACLGMLTVAWVALLRHLPAPVGLLALLFVAFAPGQVFFHSVFPMAVAGLFLMLFLASLRRERWLTAGLCGAGFAATYPTAVLLAPVTAVWLMAGERGVALGERLRRTALSAGLTAAGAGAVALAQQLQTGSWDAYSKVQAHYHHRPVEPVRHLFELLEPLGSGPLRVANAPALQAAFVAVVVTVLTLHVLARRAPSDRQDRLIAGYLLVAWLVPLSLTTVDIFRTDALLVPAALLLPRLPRPAQMLFASAAVAVSVPMAQAFLARLLGG